jgi:hypothetical protein
MCLPPSHFFPSICNKYITSLAQYALKSSDQYNLTVKLSRLLGNPCQPILELVLWIPTSAPISCYTVCTQKFQSIQLDRRDLMFPREPLSTYFETHPTTFHGHFLQFLLQIVDNFVFLVVVLCVYHLRTSFQVYAISI